MSTRSGFQTVMMALALAGSVACAAPVDDEEVGQEPIGEQVAAHKSKHGSKCGAAKAKGAFICDFTIRGDYPPQLLPPEIERDRMIMSRADGMIHKQIPISFSSTEFTNGFPDVYGGGRYLYKTWKDARDYEQFVNEDFVLDGIQFVDRPHFRDADCQAYKLVGAYEFAPIDTQQVVARTERFHMQGKHGHGKLNKLWPKIWSEAKQRNMTAVWLAYDADDDVAAVVYFIDRIVPYDPNVPDFATLGFLASSTPLGHHLEDLGWTRTFDRTQWVLTIWYPFEPGDTGKPSEWPHSPPFGEPYCGDGVCEVSRGEDASTCAVECPVNCGDAVCQPSQGENDLNCPGDCGIGPND